jgi:hypothetical protein
VNRVAPLLVLVLVSTLFFAYGRSSWSPLAGPLAACLLWALARKVDAPDERSRQQQPERRREPAPVD